MANDELIKVQLENEATGKEETVEFHASEVAAYNDMSLAEWNAQDEMEKVSLAEDYALWAFKRRLGDQDEYHVDVIEGCYEDE